MISMIFDLILGDYIYALRRLWASIKVDMGISSSFIFGMDGWMDVVG